MVNAQRGEFAYAPPAAKLGEVIILSSEEAHHLFRVRRLREHDSVWVTDGEGMVYECAVQSDQSLRILAEHPAFGECRVDIRLCCAILKGDTNRDVVDAAVQLGAREIIFFRAERSEGRLTENAREKLRRTVISSLKQCGRATLPGIKTCSNFAECLDTLAASSTIFIAHPAESPSVCEDSMTIDVALPLALVVGPEGGLTDDELTLARRMRAQLLHLAPSRLRSETAVVAGLSFLLCMAGDSGVFREK